MFSIRVWAPAKCSSTVCRSFCRLLPNILPLLFRVTLSSTLLCGRIIEGSRDQHWRLWEARRPDLIDIQDFGKVTDIYERVDGRGPGPNPGLRLLRTLRSPPTRNRTPFVTVEMNVRPRSLASIPSHGGRDAEALEMVSSTGTRNGGVGRHFGLGRQAQADNRLGHADDTQLKGLHG